MTRVFWFSGTGNSLRAARVVAGAFPDSELVPIAAVEGEAVHVRPADRIGLVFPVYAWGVPPIVERFIERLPAVEDAYAFAVLTYGGDPGRAPGMTQGLLRRRGLRLAASFGVRMPDNYPPLGGAPPPEKQEPVLRAAEERLAVIARELRAAPRGAVRNGKAFWRLAGRVAYPVFRRTAARGDRAFGADEKCNGCGVCARICPVGNIEMVAGRPHWLGHCEQCYACFHWCPQQAVQYRGRTERQVRYHHPDCAVSDMAVRPPRRPPQGDQQGEAS
ncbi:MAG: 4Fe-4S binding protein [Candidatus Brocadiaceae bacterium]|nr:4Fe-4S binding protein [Candidatus Brocadiaceae bacterium]